VAAVVKVFPGGSSGGFPGSGAAPGKRAEINGWSTAAARRLIAWLWSVEADGLPADGWAVTLTTGGRPSSAAEWHSARRSLMQRLERLGYGQQQWVIEWTAAGRPHLHMAVYRDRCVFPVRPKRSPGFAADALAAWLSICDRKGWDASARGQHIVPISDASGWLQYVSKHASRGVGHYQRQGAPEGWERTGRLWGYWGGWPVAPPVVVTLSAEAFREYRSRMVEWQAARLRSLGLDDVADAYLERHASDGDFDGISGWIPSDVSVSLLLSATEMP
jgi:hypothetical protein